MVLGVEVENAFILLIGIRGCSPTSLRKKNSSYIRKCRRAYEIPATASAITKARSSRTAHPACCSQQENKPKHHINNLNSKEKAALVLCLSSQYKAPEQGEGRVLQDADESAPPPAHPLCGSVLLQGSLLIPPPLCKKPKVNTGPLCRPASDKQNARTWCFCAEQRVEPVPPDARKTAV